MIDLTKYIVHDLSHVYDQHIDGFSAEQLNTVVSDGWNAKTLTFYSHAGTHMDSPDHFGVSDQTIDDFTPLDLMSKTLIVDVSITVTKQLITLQDVADQLKPFKPGEGLIIRTQWSARYKEPDFKSNLPRISEDLAYWCVENSVKLLGVEPLSVADVENIEEVTKIHQILLGGEVIIIEGLNNLDAIASDYVFLIALPLRIKNCDGSPARVIAFESKS